jgi:fucose permease
MKRIYPAMALAGVATTMLGPLLPGFAARGGWSDARSGILFAAQFLASVIMAAAVGPLALRYGYVALIRTGLLAIALGSGGCAAAPPSLLPLCIAVCGAGLGLLIPSANWSAAESNPGSSAAAIMWMNMSWSVGSVLAPLAIGVLAKGFLWTLAAAAIGMVFVVAQGPRESVAILRTTPVYRIETLTLIAATLLFLYSGTESALGGWLSTYARRIPGTGGLWAVLPSIYWSGVLLGRAAAPSILKSIRASRLVGLAMAGALAGTALLVAGQGPIAVAGATAMAGLCMAPIFPLVVAQYADRTGGGAASGILFAASGLGGSAIPPLVGVLAGMAGSLRVGLASLLGWLAAMMLLERKLSR